jgi:ribosome maturation factor RimP
MSLQEVGLPPLLLFWKEVLVADTLATELITLLEPLAEQAGLELVQVEVGGGAGHKTVRVYLDREGGIDIDAIAAANDWIAPALDGVARLGGPYTLEVSSPGIDRPLRKRADFERFSGERVQIHTSAPVDGRSRFTGTIVALAGDDILVDVEGSQISVPLGSIERARLKADLGQATEGSGKPR